MAISAAELAQIQADLVAQVCDKTCVIQRNTPGQDSHGSETESYHTIATTACGMQQPNSGLLTNYDFRIGALDAWHVHLPIGTDVGEGDHLIVEGKTLTVHVLLDPHSIPGLLPVLAAEIV